MATVLLVLGSPPDPPCPPSGAGLIRVSPAILESTENVFKRLFPGKKEQKCHYVLKCIAFATKAPLITDPR